MAGGLTPSLVTGFTKKHGGDCKFNLSSVGAPLVKYLIAAILIFPFLFVTLLFLTPITWLFF